MGNNHSTLFGGEIVRCTVPNKDGPAIVPLYGNTTFQSFAEILSGACAAFATLVCVVLIFLHALNYSKPSEQRHIIRAISMVSIFAILSWVTTLLSNHEAQYIIILQDLYEAYAFASFFLLVAAWIGQTPEQVSPPPYMRDESPPLKSIRLDIPQSELASIIGRRWALVFQFPVTITILTIVTEATNAAGRYCVSSNSVHFAHVWVTIIKGLSTLIAFLSLIGIVRRFKPSLAAFKPTRKLIAFKSIIGLRFIQTFIFSFLLNGDHVSPTKYLSYDDIAVSIPAIILCIEMVLFSLLFLYTFGIGPYLLENIHPEFKITSYSGGPMGLKALFQAINILDLFKGMGNSFGTA